MSFSMRLTLLLLVGLIQHCFAQLNYFDEPVVAWTALVKPMGEGNAAKISPDGEVLYVTSRDGTLTGLNPTTGVSFFSYKPPEEGATITSTSGISFFMGQSAFVTYAVQDGANGVSDNPQSRVIALSHPSGDLLWISSNIEGEASGIPHVSSSGDFVFVISNSELTTQGHFTVLDANQNGTILHTERNETNPFAPLGIFRSPSEGYFEGGESNENDVLVWAFRRNPNVYSVGEGGTFAFQFPRFYQNGDVLSIKRLREIGWQSFAAPLITNEGRSLYFSVSRNQFRGWVGAPGAKGPKFQNGATISKSFDRGTPAFLPPYNTPVINNEQSILFCGLANKSMVALGVGFDLLWMEDSESNTDILTEAVVSPDDQYVYWTESNGFLVASDALTGNRLWRKSLSGAPKSEFSISLDGTMLFVGNDEGVLSAFKIASPPTKSPSVAPSNLPSLTRSNQPSCFPTLTRMPSTLDPTGMPSSFLSPNPTAATPTDSSTPEPAQRSHSTATSSGYLLAPTVPSASIAIFVGAACSLRLLQGL